MTRGMMLGGVAIAALLGVVVWMMLGESCEEVSESRPVESFAAMVEALPVPEPEQPAVVAEEEKAPPKMRVLDMRDPTDPLKALPAEVVGGAVPVGKQRGERFNVYGRPANEFENDILESVGFNEEEIASIRENFSGYINELRDYDPDAKVTPAYRLSLEERNQNRRLRERYMTDREYDAALFATRQENRAHFIGPIPVGRAAANVGLQAGDELIELNGIRIYDNLDFLDARDSLPSHEPHRLVISRKGELFDVVISGNPGWGPVGQKLAMPLGED